jgi:ABC-type molybdenum transport system ATPase subunit/photorepair protein PhrA
MPDFQICKLFEVRRRFLRSAHLERDFSDPMALDGYVITAQARAYLERLAMGLRETSGQRAWRITGDYGSGKSSFALLLAHIDT